MKSGKFSSVAFVAIIFVFEISVTSARPNRRNSGERFQRETSYEGVNDAKDKVWDHLQDIDNVPDLAEFISSASPCMQGPLIEVWQRIQKVSYESRKRYRRDTYAAAIEQNQNVLDRLREIESVDDLTDFISSASPCLQPLLAETWKAFRRQAYESRRRNRYASNQSRREN
ncbi:unnamed protein product [Orchesella dallaii]|uniref:Uncharacterized protein n=1 Tax=Orchesella dallaii TaxID=48710 RepID=A0ABP1S2M6_9HEXA